MGPGGGAAGGADATGGGGPVGDSTSTGANSGSKRAASASKPTAAGPIALSPGGGPGGSSPSDKEAMPKVVGMKATFTPPGRFCIAGETSPPPIPFYRQSESINKHHEEFLGLKNEESLGWTLSFGRSSIKAERASLGRMVLAKRGANRLAERRTALQSQSYWLWQLKGILRVN